MPRRLSARYSHLLSWVDVDLPLKSRHQQPAGHDSHRKWERVLSSPPHQHLGRERNSGDKDRSEAVSTDVRRGSSRSLIGSVPSILFDDPVQVHPLLAVAHASTAFQAHTDEILML